MQKRKAGRFLPALVLALAACGGGDSGTEPKPVPERPVLIAIVDGANQSAPVKTELQSLVSVRVVRQESTGTGTPLANTLVSFAVPDASCGRPLANSDTTDANGTASARWELGTAAKRCKMEVRAMNQTTGAAMKSDSVFATALPGPAERIGMMASGTLGDPARTIVVGDSIAVAGLVSNVTDAYGNFIARTGLEWRVDADCDLSGCTQTGVKSSTGYAKLPGAGTFRLYVLKDPASNFLWVKAQ